MDYLNIGSTPCEEECAQVGTKLYAKRAKEECKRFIACIERKLGQPPYGARLAIKSFTHDSFGTYYEVVCFYDETSQEAINYAFKCEANAPTTWNDDKPLKELSKTPLTDMLNNMSDEKRNYYMNLKDTTEWQLW